MARVRPKKSLGQHFLKDSAIAARIVDSLRADGCDTVLEIGPGMGILTGYLIKRNLPDFRVIEIDHEAVEYLRSHFPGLTIISGDFLKIRIDDTFGERIAVIGNLPYNISSQIFFRILEIKERVPEVCVMLQKEVAERICAGPGSRTYGILSVLLQAFYNVEYLFPVSNTVFSPPPKVQSAVIRLKRNDIITLSCNEKLFFKVVKACFNQRRKTLRNSVKAAFRLGNYKNPLLDLRPEQLSVQQFTDLVNWIDESSRNSE
jgi:16S rRNA (adenine1518-N6/adenine1519-N6)-dimethyltransferase